MNTQKNVIWVVVANQAEAEIYAMQSLRGPLTSVETLTHEAGRAHARDMASDAPGRVHDRVGQARHSMESDVGIKKEEMRRFSQRIVDHLEAAHRTGSFDRLIFMAAPEFLGALRKAVSGQLAKVVIEEIPKDMVGQPNQQIQAHLS